jgi:electron transfer flavoprotein alpha subunit
VKTAIVVLPGENDEAVREKITAAWQAGKESSSPSVFSPEIWWFNADKDIAEQLPVESVFCLSGPGKAVADCYLPTVKYMVEERKPGLILFSGGILAKDLCAALACAVNGCCALGITGMTKEDQGIRITRYVQGMQLEGSFLYTGFPCFLCLVKGTFKPAAGQGKPELFAVERSQQEPSWFEDYEETVIEEDDGLERFDVIAAGGRGLGSKDAAANLLELGRYMGFGTGATRPAALNAWMPLNRMIGISGYTLKPKLCVTFGISGCAPFIRGIEKSGFVISINNDPDAAIFRYSDLGLAADCNEIIRYLLKRTKENKGE